MKYLLITGLVLMIVFSSCKKEDNTVYQTYFWTNVDTALIKMDIYINDKNKTLSKGTYILEKNDQRFLDPNYWFAIQLFKKEGIEREFNEKFMIRSTPYHNNKKEGYEVKYSYVSGALSEVNVYRKGKKETSTAYTNGKVTNITEFDGEMYHGLDQAWSQKGHILLSVMPYRFGIAHGLQKVYYPDGKIRYEVPYENGKKNGVLRAYYPNGSLHYKITYKNDLPDEVGYVYNKTGRKERIDYDTLMSLADKLPKPVERWRQ